ncbi:MAG: glycerate kinase, partial [Rhodococcus sp. (in: high G+C Gram-positive bacteria)]|nr:glycerate kinase [Rhodococcus sp. (in: high G+C Gram-positive bacteria)]MDX5452314.1 glycerate kinase [Rhodococcus sp. (in: high G+C Gram-positive bacteria)]
VVGEGRLDGQSRSGKIVSAILARVHAAPVVAVVGSVGDDLGDYRDRFAEIMIATDLDALRAAGARLARLG